jgi:hypothetical protein
MQCDSQFVTKYYGSYLKETKLWIIMEYLGGGSALDLVTITFPPHLLLFAQSFSFAMHPHSTHPDEARTMR